MNKCPIPISWNTKRMRVRGKDHRRMTATVLTIFQQFWALPAPLARPQLVISTQLLVNLPQFCPLPDLIYCTATPMPTVPGNGGRPFLEPGRIVHRPAKRPHELKGNWIPIGQIKMHRFTNQVCTHYSGLPVGSGMPGAAPTSEPSHIGSRSFWCSCAAIRADLLGRDAGSTGANNSFSYMKNTRTVKVTYWACVVFCSCLVVGASRCLG